MPHALLVEDHSGTLSALSDLVKREGFTTAAAGSLEEAREQLVTQPPDVMLVDLHLPDGDGLVLLDELDPRSAPAIVLITGQASIESAVAALRRGVSDYLTKPIDLGRLKTILRDVAQTGGLKQEIHDLNVKLPEVGAFGHLVGASRPMQSVYELISRVAPSNATVLITGESGTGKELVARTTHELSRRRHGPFVAVNCGAISPTLMESELFGHERGSFTGAERRHRGYFERASRGTLLLDEITEMPIDLQVKVLRALETGSFNRVGGEDPITVDVRIVAATNRVPEDAIAQGRLRDDLYYRLKVFQLSLPPLKERLDDIETLTAHFVQHVSSSEGGPIKEVAAETFERLRAYHWPGNVRELKNVIYSAYILANAVITPTCLPPEVLTGKPAPIDASSVHLRVGTSLADAERRLILATLSHLDGNKTRTAEILGISLKTLYNRLQEYRQPT